MNHGAIRRMMLGLFITSIGIIWLFFKVDAVYGYGIKRIITIVMVCFGIMYGMNIYFCNFPDKREAKK